MPFDNDTLIKIYKRTDGRCHICNKRLSFVNYARPGRRGAWEVEHSNPKAKGGTDYFRNLFPACIDCNRVKGTATTRTARARHGRRRAPLSKEKQKEARFSNAIVGGFIGGILGLFIAPWVGVVGVLIGSTVGHNINPDK
jgi:hypothetical protein